MGEIAGWNGASWVCTSDNTLDLAGLQTMLQNNAVDLNAGSTIGGVAILTSVDDNDTLGSLSCANDGEIARYDIVTNSWYCDADSVLTETDVETMITNAGIDLHANTTVNGKLLVSMPPNCTNGQILSYQSASQSWICIDFSTIIDQDSDGVLTWNDCDDNDLNAGSSIDDTDCDGVIAVQDCDDGDPNSTIISTDGDCDGVLTADDCDDGDGNSTIRATDGDCDTILTADDCDDGDANSTIRATDGDCDGVITADDCDDTNSALTYYDGQTSSCPATSCSDILDSGYSVGDGTYWISPTNGTAFRAHCDMTTDGGGWTMCYTAGDSNMVHLQTQTTYTGTYGSSGYRTDCRDIPFSDVLYVNHNSNEKAWFSTKNGSTKTIRGLGYNADGGSIGTVFTAHGVAATNTDYQLMVCDTSWMWVGLMISGYNGCYKACGSWCNDTSSQYYRTDGSDTGSYNGIAFKENGHTTVSYKTMSVGLRD